jgi:site-specific DNA recombinase
VAEQLNALGHVQKRYATRSGRARGGGRWTRNAVHLVLRNPLYVGKVRSRGGQLHVAEHEAIVGLDVFEAAAASLDDRTTGRTRRSRTEEYLLAQILRCAPCGTTMWPSMAKGRNGRRYRYYRCRQHQRGARDCPSGLIAAAEIEKATVAQVAEMARREDVRQRVVDRAKAEADHAGQLQKQRNRLEAQLEERNNEARRLLGALGSATEGGKLLAVRLGELETEIDALQFQIHDVGGRLLGAQEASRNAEHLAALLEAFDQVWDVLVPEERNRLVRLMVEEVAVEDDRIRIKLHDGPATPASTQGVA